MYHQCTWYSVHPLFEESGRAKAPMRHLSCYLLPLHRMYCPIYDHEGTFLPSKWLPSLPSASDWNQFQGMWSGLRRRKQMGSNFTTATKYCVSWSEGRTGNMAYRTLPCGGTGLLALQQRGNHFWQSYLTWYNICCVKMCCLRMCTIKTKAFHCSNVKVTIATLWFLMKLQTH